MPKFSIQSKLLTAIVSTCFVLLSGCGGGGGGSAVVPPLTTPVAATTTTSVITLDLTDTFTGTFAGNGFGVWGGDGGGDGGGADGGGGAGDGEFVKVKIRFPYTGQPDGTLTWTVLKSQYNIAGSSGVLTIRVDSPAGSAGTGGKGGYRVVASTVNGVSTPVRPNQANIFLSPHGVITGTLPRPINGGKDSAFTGFRFANATTAAISDYAGQYAFARTLADSGSGANQQIDAGVFNLNADGTGRFCQQLSYSATCTNGLDVVASFTDSNNNVVQIKPASVQSTSFSGSYPVAGSAIAVFRKFGSNSVSFTADLAFVRNDSKAITGALYASRITGASAVNLNGVLGSYNATIKKISGGLAFVASIELSSANIGGTFKSRVGPGITTCPPSETLTAGPVNGVVTSTSTTNPIPTYAVQLDNDTFVFVQSGFQLGIARRYSNDPNATACPAN